VIAMPFASPQPASAAVPPITSAAEAAQLGAHFSQVMESLLGIVEEETELVRSGRLRDAAKLEEPKGELARLYMKDSSRVRACRTLIARHAPELYAELRRRHDLFQALLQINLTVLATAHAVAEGLVRGVSGEMARKTAPQTYTAAGRNSKAPNTAMPMAVSRQL
jgi:hypothetical protein